MARIGGRNSFMAWVVGLGSAAVVAALVVLALPAIPAGIQMVGDTLRSSTSAPVAQGEAAAPQATSSTPLCQGLYTEALWAELTQRAGGVPVQDTSAPRVSATTLVASLAPEVTVSCTFTGINTGSLVTTVAKVDAGAARLARSTLETAGYECGDFGDGVRCRLTTAEGAEDQVIRDGVWLASEFTGWHPDRYTERVALQLWPS
ncbi:hypothetical protein [Microbacterium sp. SORGH_AS_0862]|uniref:hypothetical protein n=1 Tax=Microbacterium sp. SORGH_AS_0862 TaxID=3041789 RepID=UPI00278E7444|nr:hypothetical protein [Microbacterium sp. SORGH_AS_0862]MDQ1205635.1 hypothetical protein [Microbacterium sp. SORGH_AS_0862]